MKELEKWITMEALAKAFNVEPQIIRSEIMLYRLKQDDERSRDSRFKSLIKNGSIRDFKNGRSISYIAEKNDIEETSILIRVLEEYFEVEKDNEGLEMIRGLYMGAEYIVQLGNIESRRNRGESIETIAEEFQVDLKKLLKLLNFYRKRNGYKKRDCNRNMERVWADIEKIIGRLQNGEKVEEIADEYGVRVPQDIRDAVKQVNPGFYDGWRRKPKKNTQISLQEFKLVFENGKKKLSEMINKAETDGSMDVSAYSEILNDSDMIEKTLERRRFTGRINENCKSIWCAIVK